MMRAPMSREMRSPRWVVLAFSLTIAGTARGQGAPEGGGGDDLAQLREQMRAMAERQGALERENAALRERVDAMQGGGVVVGVGSEEGGEDGGEEERVATQTALIEEILNRRDESLRNHEFGFNPAGGGFFIKGDDYQFRLLGYVQAVGTAVDGSFNRADEPGDFSVRRARIDFLADFYEKFQILVEFDGGPGTTPTAASDFALVEARLNWQVVDDDVQLRFGKFTTPLSTENYRSSRSIDTVERYMALNSLFLLPAVDVQYGVMVHGLLGEENRFGYFLGGFNGNGRANDNFSDDNGAKEVQAKFTYQFTPDLTAGLGLDYSREERQALALADLAFNRYVAVDIEGDRYGIGADVYWKSGPWSFRAEGLAFRFDTPSGEDAGLYGGFLQPGYFITGDENRGVQLLLRPEFAKVDGDTGGDGDTIYSLTFGVNWFVNPNVRVQLNPVLTYFDGPSSLQGFDDSRLTPLLLTEVQFKF